MTTVINSPRSSDDSGMGIIVTVLVVIVLVVLFFVYALPAIRNSNPPADNNSLDINIDLPSGNTGDSGAPSPSPTP